MYSEKHDDLDINRLNVYKQNKNDVIVKGKLCNALRTLSFTLISINDKYIKLV